MGDGGAIAQMRHDAESHRRRLAMLGFRPSTHRRRHAWFPAPGGNDLAEYNLTKRRPWTVKASRRAASKIAKASRRRNRGVR